MDNPLSTQTIETVKSTIPFLQENGVALTEHFYKRMFEGNPEVREYFNTSNQESGAQQRALGGAICAFAMNIETPENLSGAVSRISNKHVSLGILPEHYPIVGQHLLGAIDDILNPAPSEVLAAWGEAYEFLAGVMIGAESDLYADQKAEAGGWNGFRKMEVFRREHESQWITSFYLRPLDEQTLPPFKAGQYTTVRIPAKPDNDSSGNAPVTTMRNYSLSGSPEWPHYRISVKREVPRHADTPEGYVSSYLHTSVGVGNVIEIGPPCGDFHLLEHSTDTPILLLSGGVGITPLLAMAHAVKENRTTFLHGAIDGKNHAHREEVLQLAQAKPNLNVHFRYSAPTHEDEQSRHHHSEGLFSTDFLANYINPKTEVYFCGPKPMMQHVYKALRTLQHPEDKSHYEFFGPQEELDA